LRSMATSSEGAIRLQAAGNTCMAARPTKNAFMLSRLHQGYARK